MIIPPLEGLDLSTRPRTLQGGYDYLQLTEDGVYHPGLDLNSGNTADADCGKALIAVRRSVVRYSGWHVTASGRGFGNHTWLETDTGHFLGYCHAAMGLPSEGTVFQPGQPFGVCGKTVGWGACHCHFVVRDIPPGDWTEWVSGWTYQRVAREYRDPYAWLLQYAVEGQVNMDEVEALKAEISHLNTVNTILAAERDYKDQLLVAANSRIGSLEVDVIPSLSSLVEDLRRQLGERVAAAPAGAVKRVDVTLDNDRVEVFSR